MLFRQNCEIIQDDNFVGLEKSSCHYWFLNENITSQRQLTSKNGQQYRYLSAFFELSDSACLHLSYVCLIKKTSNVLMTSKSIAKNTCVRVSNGNINLPAINNNNDSLCIQSSEHHICVDKYTSSIYEDGAIVKLCSTGAVSRVEGFSWKPTRSGKIFYFKESKLAINFTLVNAKNSAILPKKVFSVQIILADTNQSKNELVSDTTPLAHSDLKTISFGIIVDNLELGDALRFISIPIRIPQFSADVCSQASHIGLVVYEPETNFLNPGNSKVFWSVLNPSSLECRCNGVDLKLEKFYTDSYFLKYSNDVEFSVDFYAFIKYNLKDDNKNFFDSVVPNQLFSVVANPAILPNASNIFQVTGVNVNDVFEMNVNRSESQCPGTSGTRIYAGRLTISHPETFKGTDCVQGKYFLKATVNSPSKDLEIDSTNNQLSNEVVFVGDNFDVLQLLSAVSSFTISDDLVTFDIYLTSQYSGTYPVSVLAGSDVFNVDAYFGLVASSDSFSSFDSARVLKLNSDQDCGRFRSGKNLDYLIKPGETVLLHRRFYSSLKDILDFSCKGFSNLVATLSLSSVYSTVTETFFKNNAIELPVPETIRFCNRTLLPHQGLYDVISIPVVLSIDFPQIESNFIADGTYLNKLMVALQASIQVDLNPELVKLYSSSSISENVLTVEATLNLIRPCFPFEPCDVIELHKIKFTFDASKLLTDNVVLDDSKFVELVLSKEFNVCGWAELSWKFKLWSSDQSVVFFTQHHSGCPSKAYPIFVLCNDNPLSVSSFMQIFPPVVQTMETEGTFSKTLSSSIRMYKFQISAIVTEFSASVSKSNYVISLCKFTLCTASVYGIDTSVRLNSYNVMSDMYPYFSKHAQVIPGVSYLIQIDGEIELDIFSQMTTLKIPIYISQDSQIYQFFGALTINPKYYFKSVENGVDSFRVKSFSLFGGSTIKKTLSGKLELNRKGLSFRFKPKDFFSIEIKVCESFSAHSF